MASTENSAELKPPASVRHTKAFSEALLARTSGFVPMTRQPSHTVGTLGRSAEALAQTLTARNTISPIRFRPEWILALLKRYQMAPWSLGIPSLYYFRWLRQSLEPEEEAYTTSSSRAPAFVKVSSSDWNRRSERSAAETLASKPVFIFGERVIWRDRPDEYAQTSPAPSPADRFLGMGSLAAARPLPAMLHLHTRMSRPGPAAWTDANLMRSVFPEALASAVAGRIAPPRRQAHSSVPFREPASLSMPLSYPPVPLASWLGEAAPPPEQAYLEHMAVYARPQLSPAAAHLLVLPKMPDTILGESAFESPANTAFAALPRMTARQADPQTQAFLSDAFMAVRTAAATAFQPMRPLLERRILPGGQAMPSTPAIASGQGAAIKGTGQREPSTDAGEEHPAAQKSVLQAAQTALAFLSRSLFQFFAPGADLPLLRTVVPKQAVIPASLAFSSSLLSLPRLRRTERAGESGTERTPSHLATTAAVTNQRNAAPRRASSASLLLVLPVQTRIPVTDQAIPSTQPTQRLAEKITMGTEALPRTPLVTWVSAQQILQRIASQTAGSPTKTSARAVPGTMPPLSLPLAGRLSTAIGPSVSPGQYRTVPQIGQQHTLPQQERSTSFDTDAIDATTQMRPPSLGQRLLDLHTAVRMRTASLIRLIIGSPRQDTDAVPASHDAQSLLTVFPGKTLSADLPMVLPRRRFDQSRAENIAETFALPTRQAIRHEQTSVSHPLPGPAATRPSEVTMPQIPHPTATVGSRPLPLADFLSTLSGQEWLQGWIWDNPAAVRDHERRDDSRTRREPRLNFPGLDQRPDARISGVLSHASVPSMAEETRSEGLSSERPTSSQTALPSHGTASDARVASYGPVAESVFGRYRQQAAGFALGDLSSATLVVSPTSPRAARGVFAFAAPLLRLLHLGDWRNALIAQSAETLPFSVSAPTRAESPNLSTALRRSTERIPEHRPTERPAPAYRLTERVVAERPQPIPQTADGESATPRLAPPHSVADINHPGNLSVFLPLLAQIQQMARFTAGFPEILTSSVSLSSNSAAFESNSAAFEFARPADGRQTPAAEIFSRLPETIRRLTMSLARAAAQVRSELSQEPNRETRGITLQPTSRPVFAPLPATTLFNTATLFKQPLSDNTPQTWPQIAADFLGETRQEEPIRFASLQGSPSLFLNFLRRGEREEIGKTPPNFTTFGPSSGPVSGPADRIFGPGSIEKTFSPVQPRSISQGIHDMEAPASLSPAVVERFLTKWPLVRLMAARLSQGAVKTQEDDRDDRTSLSSLRLPSRERRPRHGFGTVPSAQEWGKPNTEDRFTDFETAYTAAIRETSISTFQSLVLTPLRDFLFATLARILPDAEETDQAFSYPELFRQPAAPTPVFLQDYESVSELPIDLPMVTFPALTPVSGPAGQGYQRRRALTAKSSDWSSRLIQDRRSDVLESRYPTPTRPVTARKSPFPDLAVVQSPASPQALLGQPGRFLNLPGRSMGGRTGSDWEEPETAVTSEHPLPVLLNHLLAQSDRLSVGDLALPRRTNDGPYTGPEAPIQDDRRTISLIARHEGGRDITLLPTLGRAGAVSPAGISPLAERVPLMPLPGRGAQTMTAEAAAMHDPFVIQRAISGGVATASQGSANAEHSEDESASHPSKGHNGGDTKDLANQVWALLKRKIAQESARSGHV